MSYKNILAAVELQTSNSIFIQRAAAFASMSGAKLSVATVIPDLTPLYHGTEQGMQRSFDQSLVDSAHKDLAALCRTAKVTAQEIIVARGDPDKEIVEEAAARQIDLILFGNHDRHGLDHFVGGFGLGLLHRADCDLFAFGLANSGSDFSKPLVAVGNDQFDRNILTRAREHFVNQHLSLVHAIRPNVLEYLDLSRDVDVARTELVAQARAELDSNLREFEPYDLHLTFETPSKGIEHRAVAGGHQLLILGSGRHSALGWRLGSTAHNVLSRTQSDVLLVRPNLET